MSTGPIIEAFRLGPQWKTYDPFLFCAHHDDAYPAGDERMAPVEPLTGRNLGMDFDPNQAWRMYHGSVVPGFPAHPHRGFETVTIARHGFIDHSDSLGAAARFGDGDVQWVTAGAGIVHSEMFPLVYSDRGNRTELFQIWLNLPAAGKMAAPHFKMIWRDQVERHRATDADGRSTELVTITGDPLRPEDTPASGTLPAPPPDSWAATPDNRVRLSTLRMEPGARYTLPPADPSVTRAIYYFVGDGMTIAGFDIPGRVGARLEPGAAVELVNGDSVAELLLMEGRPINEPVAQQGPFVMNTPGEIRQAMMDYQRTRFGGWPWPSDAPAHPRERGRFADYGDGRVEEPS